MNKKVIEEFKSILIPAEFYTNKVYTELSLSKEESMTILKYINNLEEQNNKYKNTLDKIKENNQLIIDLGFDYDGLNTVESLKGLIDELVYRAVKNKELLEKIE